MTFWVAGAVVAGGVASAAIGSKAAGNAADSQAASAAQADATQRYMYDTTRADNAPFLNNGSAASNALAYRLGLSPSPTASAPSQASYKPLTGADLFDTSGAEWRPNADMYASDPAYKNAYDQFIAAHQARFHTAPGNSKGSDVNNAAQSLKDFGFDIDAANQARQQAAQQPAQVATAQVMPQSAQPAQAGSLLRDFTQADLEADPVYQNGLKFGLDEGTKGINQIASASGSMLSGATLKALAKYGNDYGSTKANESFNRFNANRDSTYNKLAALAGSGQTATSQVGAAGVNMANNISANQIGVGNARAASSIGQANALTGAIGQGYNMYQNNRLMDSLQNGNYRPNASGYGTNPYAGYDAPTNGGWGIE